MSPKSLTKIRLHSFPKSNSIWSLMPFCSSEGVESLYTAFLSETCPDMTSHKQDSVPSHRTRLITSLLLHPFWLLGTVDMIHQRIGTVFCGQNSTYPRPWKSYCLEMNSELDLGERIHANAAPSLCFPVLPPSLVATGARITSIIANSRSIFAVQYCHVCLSLWIQVFEWWSLQQWDFNVATADSLSLSLWNEDGRGQRVMKAGTCLFAPTGWQGNRPRISRIQHCFQSSQEMWQ